ncbi:MAG: CBS domain-containing protein [Bacteriovoracaceae bacterium]|jgi:CBS domain-containing protein|nr:CBS domain-containing protein [Bacteriovoracaceae bacterium]
MKAEDFMTKNVISCNENSTVKQAAEIMLEHGVGGLPIVNDAGDLVGILTESDFVGKKVDIPHALVSMKQLFGETFFHGSVDDIFAKAKDYKLHDVMTKNPITVAPDASLTEVSTQMLERKINRLPVEKDGKLIGFITRKDLLRAFIKL